MKIIISESSNIPIYEQIIKQIKDGIINQELTPEAPLPSIRQLAKDLQISVITTKRAYEELEAEGMVYSLPGKGFYVTPRKVEMLKEKKLQMIEDGVLDVIKECKSVGMDMDELMSMVEVLWNEEN